MMSGYLMMANLLSSFGMRIVTHRRLVEEILCGILLLIPLGFWIGLCSIRLSAKYNPLPKLLPPQVWTSFVLFVLCNAVLRFLLLPFTRCLPMEESELSQLSEAMSISGVGGGSGDAEYIQSILSNAGKWPPPDRYSLSWFLNSYGFNCPPSEPASTISTGTSHHQLQLEQLIMLGRSATAILLSIRLFCICLGVYFGESYMPICLTGGIACGKSTVAEYLVGNTSKRHGSVTLICADSIAHEILLPPEQLAMPKLQDDHDASAAQDQYIVKPYHSVYHAISQAFEGHDILRSPDNDDKRQKETATTKASTDLPPPIDRRKLGAVVFANRDLRRRLNKITHPRILTVLLQNLIRSLWSWQSNSLTIADIPLLYESGMLRYLLCGINICVAISDPKLQLCRLMERNPDLSREECFQRIDSQLPMETKMRLSDIVIDNTGTISDLQARVETVREELYGRIHGALLGISLCKMLLLVGSIMIAANFVEA